MDAEICAKLREMACQNIKQKKKSKILSFSMLTSTVFLENVDVPSKCQGGTYVVALLVLVSTFVLFSPFMRYT